MCEIRVECAAVGAADYFIKYLTYLPTEEELKKELRLDAFIKLNE